MLVLLGALASLPLVVQAEAPHDDAADRLARLVDAALADNPDLAAARAAVDAASARLDGAGRPLNNPELALESERSDITTVTLGLAQTLDWHDKRGAREQLARTELARAQAALALLRYEKSRDLLDALGRVVTLREVVTLSQQRLDAMQRFAGLAEKRHRAGDISRSERELARLSLSEAVIEHARNEAELAQAEGDYRAIAMKPLPTQLALPDAIGELPTAATGEQSLASHPRLQPTLLAARLARERIEATDRDRRADPTLGVTAGREDDNGLIGLSLALPLRLRNRFDADVNAARAEALQARQQADQIRRALTAGQQTAATRHSLMAAAWQRWRDEGARSLEERIALLEKLWQAGEIDTTDYLLQLRQTLDTRIAGARLRGDLWDAWIAWLDAAGSLTDWLHASNKLDN